MIIPGEEGFNVMDVMGNHYLFCHSYDAGIEVVPTHVNFVDAYYGRSFLLELCEFGSLGGALRDLYLYARPHTYLLHKKSDWEVLIQLSQMLETEELRVWLIRDALMEHAAELQAKSSSAEPGAATSNATAKPVKRRRQAEAGASESQASLEPIASMHESESSDKQKAVSNKGKLTLGKKKEQSTSSAKPIVALDAGKASGKRGVKGTWHEELENPKPNTIYEVTSVHEGEPVTYKYETDDQCRTVRVTGKLKRSAIKDQAERDKLHRNTTTQSKYGGDDPDYDGGHLIATLFQGPAEKVNLVPQLKDQNRHGEWRQMEKEWAKELDKGRDVEVEILVEYGDDGCTPEAIFGGYKVDNGNRVPFDFEN